MHEPARLPPRLHHQSARILVRKRRSVEEDHFVNAWRRSGERGARRRPRRASSRPAPPRGRPSRTRAARGTRRAPRRIGRWAPSSTLSAMPSPSRAAQRSPSAPPFATQPSPSRMSSVSAAPSPRISSGSSTHRVGGARAAVERLEPREGVRHPLEGQRDVRTPQPSTAVGIDVGLDLRRGGDLGEHRLLARVRRQPVALGRPAVDAAEEQHRRVLPRAVVLEPGRLRAALEVVLGRAGLRRAGAARARAGRADADATRTRSRSRRRRGPAARGRPAAPGSASPSSGRT